MKDYQCCSILVTDMTNPSYYFFFFSPQNCQLSFIYDPSLICSNQMAVGDYKQPYYMYTQCSSFQQKCVREIVSQVEKQHRASGRRELKCPGGRQIFALASCSLYL